MRIVGITALCAIYSAYALVLMEWLFFATKPSFLSILGATERFAVLGVAALPLLVASLTLAIAAGLLSLSMRENRLALALRIVVPSLILATLFTLMADNFANTVLGIGLLHAVGVGRLAGVLIVVLLFFLGVRAARSLFGLLDNLSARRAIPPAVVLVGGSALALIASAPGMSTTPDRTGQPTASFDSRPNILILGGDGLNADRLSCYGYERDTTPFLGDLAPKMLLCESAFSNCAHTGGALISLLTGRLPTDHRVVYAPDILRDSDAYLHLPGILRRNGYATLQVTVRHYADAYDFNLRGGFNRANFRDEHEALAAPRLTSLIGEEAAFLWEQIVDRVRTRARHLVTSGPLPNPYDEVKSGRGASFSDRARVDELMDFIDEAEAPFFAHLHLMGTHGKTFKPLDPHYSKEQEQTEPWMKDFYDDAVRDFDGWAREILDGLQSRGILDDTIVVFYSDHTMRFSPLGRVPLLFRFPGDAHAGRVTSNTQLADVAPTLLDYLGADMPEWMAGVSLIADEPDPMRPIYSAMVPPDFQHRGRVADPPFRTLGRFSAVICNQRSMIRTTTAEFIQTSLPPRAADCDSASIPSPIEVQQLMVQHLSDAGYDVSSLAVLESPDR